jgi:hypothetical protein
MKRKVKRLQLNKESIRLLNLDEIREAAGGFKTEADTCVSLSCGPSCTCPTGNTRCTPRSCIC